MTDSIIIKPRNRKELSTLKKILEALDASFVLKKEVKDELKDKFNETAVGYIHVFNKRLEEKLR